MIRARKLSLISLTLILLLWIAPLMMALAAGGVARALGCTLNENTSHPCLLFGSDIGQWLYTFGVLGWLTIIGIPFVAMALLLWVVVSVILNRRKPS